MLFKKGIFMRFLIFFILSLSLIVSNAAEDNEVIEEVEVVEVIDADRENGFGFAPAVFVQGGKSIEAALFAPRRVDNVDRTIFCSAVVGIRGRIQEQLCNWSFENKQYAPTLNQAAGIARFKPATVNGKAVVAYIKYSVRVSHADGKAQFEVFPHHFANEQFHGDDYIAAQSYSSGNKLDIAGSHFFGKPWIQENVPVRCVRSSRVFMQFKVNREGAVEDLSTIDGSRPKKCIEPVKAAVMAGQYIPAFDGGKPVESVYVEKYYSDSSKTKREFSRVQ